MMNKMTKKVVVSYDGVEYKVDPVIAELVAEAFAYRRVLDGKSPKEIDEWMDKALAMSEALERRIDEILGEVTKGINLKDIK